MKAIINYYSLTESASESDNVKIYVGECESFKDIYGSEWIEYEDANNAPYRYVFINLNERAIFSYCEGDLKLRVFSNSIDFFKYLVTMAEFYLNN